MPQDDKPSTIEEYLDWLRKNCVCQVDGSTRRRYDEVKSIVKDKFERFAFWQELVASLRQLDQQYNLKYGCPLLMREEAPDLLTNDFDSFLHKTFRRNVLENRSWPNPPRDGWFLPDRCHDRINDMVRTMFVVKMLDGVAYFWDHVKQTANNQSLDCRVYYEARDEGYYAGHIYLFPEIEIPSATVGTEKRTFQIEMQVTTQVKEVIKNLLHPFYEKRRSRTKPPSEKWQWQFDGDEFIPNYLGHILQYLEGMMMQVRKKQGDSE